MRASVDEAPPITSAPKAAQGSMTWRMVVNSMMVTLPPIGS
jgi:hypothetical protein